MKKLTAIMTEKRRQAMIALVLFGAIQLSFVVLFGIFYEQFKTIIIPLEIILLGGFAFIYFKLGVHNGFSKLKKGIVLSRKVNVYLHRETVAWLSGYHHKTIGYLEIFMGMSVEKFSMTQEQLNAYMEGDNIMWSRAIRFPVLLDRKTGARLCPFCGTIHNDENVDNCYYCDKPITFSYDEDEMKNNLNLYEDQLPK